MDILNPLKGRLLIAEASTLQDTSFNRSIILLTEYSVENAIGFVLNKPMEYTIHDLLPDIDCHFTIYQGGPVEQDNLYFIHQVPHLLPDSIQVTNNMYWGGNFKVLSQLLKTQQIKNSEIRFFLGYAGWEANQLEGELEENTWFVTENDYENVFATDSQILWKNKMLQKGGAYQIWANAPSNIQLN